MSVVIVLLCGLLPSLVGIGFLARAFLPTARAWNGRPRVAAPVARVTCFFVGLAMLLLAAGFLGAPTGHAPDERLFGGVAAVACLSLCAGPPDAPAARGK